MRIVMLNGHVACLKTTLGYFLAPALGLGHVTNSVLGAFVSDDSAPSFQMLREARYSSAIAVARQYLEEGASVLLDGTFARRAWRESIYQLASNFGVEDVVAITCVCSDPALIQRRLEYRRLASDSPDAEANHWAAYTGSVRAFEAIDDDRLPTGRRPSRLHFDSASFKVRRDVVFSPYAETVAVALERIASSGRLSRPQFGFGQAGGLEHSSAANRLVALEGLGGSGKSTQAGRLARLLVRQNRRVCVFEEFSDGAIGRYLRGRSAIGDDHRIRLAEGSPFHSQCLLVIGDALARVRMALERRLAGESMYDVILADSYIWSYLAHGLARLPEAPNVSLRQSLCAGLSEILAPLGAVAEFQETVFLRIDPEVAIERVEGRLGRTLSPAARVFLIRMADIYDEFAELGRTTVVDASASPDQVTDQIAIALSL